jgi:uncharacterized protein (TIGR03084 family)
MGSDAAREIITDLAAEQEALDAVVADLAPERWASPTASSGWAVADQIAHLTYFDGTAHLALVDPAAFRSHRNELIAAFADPAGVDEVTLGPLRALAPGELLAKWRRRRVALLAAAGAADPEGRVEWYGPSMSLRSFLTARLMETWAHGQDVVDAVDGVRPATDRLRHVAQLGVITRGWSYRNRGLEPPAGEVRVELQAPSGATWTWGPDDAEETVAGPAEDFCLVVTQRRHVDDTALTTNGPLAREWMELAQAFAGPATTGPHARRTT